MSWEPWPRQDEKFLAKYVTTTGNTIFPLKNVSVFDLSSDPQGQRRIVEAIYNMLLDSGIQYSLEEYHPSDKLQKIRTPKQIKEENRGTCLDLAALFCGLCLANELLPMLIITSGHAFAAVSLTHYLREWNGYRPEYSWFEQGPLRNIEELRQLIKDGSWLAVECTGFARSQRLAHTTTEEPECLHRTADGMDFENALLAGKEQLYYEPRLHEFFALDIAIAHYSWRITDDLEVEIPSADWDESKKPPGRFVCKMCDRTPQLTRFMESFWGAFEKCPNRPQVYVIHGSKYEAHDSFIKVLRKDLEEQFEKKRLEGIPSKIFPIPWADRGKLDDRKDSLQKNLFTEFKEWDVKDYSANTLSQLSCIKCNCPVFISHNLDASAWNERNDESLLRWYVEDYWGKLVVGENVPLFLIFIKLLYEEEGKKGWFGRLFGQRKDINQSIIQRLENIQESINKDCPFKVLEELSPVEEIDVRNWFDKYIPYGGVLQREKYIESLFTEREVCRPMAKIEEFCEKNINQIYPGWERPSNG
jgi:hypothetical protein